MTTPPSGSTPRPPLQADRDRLARFLKDKRPILWVGAGASMAAGYPGTNDLIRGMIEAAEDPIDPDLPFFQIADRFVESQGGGDLADLLQRLLGPPRDPAPLHLAIARLAKAGFFQAIVTTNYDDLLERALAGAGVPYILQPLEQNAPVTAEGHIRLLKLHGSLDDWLSVVLSGESYARFGQQFPFLVSQLDVLLRQHPVLFIGCSLEDPRILDWLMAWTPEASRALKPWRALMTQSGWEKAAKAEALTRGNIRPYLLESHGQLGELLHAVAGEVKPDLARLEIEVTVGDRWQAKMTGCPNWEPRDPLADADLQRDLEKLRDLGLRYLPTDERGHLSPKAEAVAGALRTLAASVGERLTAALLSPAARERLEAAVHAGSAGTPPLLVLKVRPAADGLEAERRADRALALPWELLRLEERFPVEEGTLDLAREAMVDKLPELTPPDRPLSIVATVAAPVDAGPFDHEEEMYLLWRALGEKKQEKRLLITDRGMLDDLAGAVERYTPPVVHFAGHGVPGVLFFEDEEALSHRVAVTELIRRFRETGPLPRLVYLSACHGATAKPAAAGSYPGERMVDPTAMDQTAPSTAASLHRAGFPQVVAYFGPVHDRQATRAAASFYTTLGRGRTAWEALRHARRVSSEPLRDAGRAAYVYPLGWAQLALYHRGPGHATTLPPALSNSVVDLPQEERKRIFEPLSRPGGSPRIEGIVGIQRLRFGFVGRRRERADAIRRWKQGQRLLVVQGLGGLGKTSLCAEVAPVLAEMLKQGVRVLALDGRHAGTQADPVIALWQEVQAARSDEGWSQALADIQKEGLTAMALARALVILSQAEEGLLVYLDDAESLQLPIGVGDLGRWRDPGFAQFWQHLVKTAQEWGAFGVLASSRYQPEGTPVSAVLPLPDMSRYEVVRLLSWMPTLGRMPASDRVWLAEKVKGHPRTVEYLEALARARETEIVSPGRKYNKARWREEILEPILPQTEEEVSADLLLGKLWDSLPLSAQEHLGRCSVLTAPVPWGAIQALAPEGGTEDRLFEAGLLSPYQAPVGKEPWWVPHRLVNKELSGRWVGNSIEIHRILGGWFERQHNEDSWGGWQLIAVKHLLAAKEADRAWPLAKRVTLTLRNAGRYQEALELVGRILAASPTNGALGMALTFQAQLQHLAGVSGIGVEASLLEALALVKSDDQSVVLAELARWYREQGQLQRAAKCLVRSVESQVRVSGTEDDPRIAGALHELAIVLHLQGDLVGALEHLERSLKIQEKVLDTEYNQNFARTLNTIALVLRDKGDLVGAKERLERSLQIGERVFRSGHHQDVAGTLHSLAGVLIAQGDLSAARRCLERALEIWDKVHGKDHRSFAITEASLGSLLLEHGEIPRGVELLGHAYTVFLRQLGPNASYTCQVADLLAEFTTEPPRSSP